MAACAGAAGLGGGCWGWLAGPSENPAGCCAGLGAAFAEAGGKLGIGVLAAEGKGPGRGLILLIEVLPPVISLQAADLAYKGAESLGGGVSSHQVQTMGRNMHCQCACLAMRMHSSRRDSAANRAAWLIAEAGSALRRGGLTASA